jgi:hypothetical protein
VAHKLLGAGSNGEYAPRPASPLVREASRRVAAHAERHERRDGIDRRSFLRSSMGAAATLLTLSACSKEERGAGDPPAGSFDVPPDATTETSAAGEVLAPFDGEVVVDVQTHFLDPDPGGFGAGFPQAGCGDDECFTIDHWTDLVLGASDTSIAVLSAIPVVDDDSPLSIEKMEEARRLADRLCGEGRVLLQGEAFPQVGAVDAALERMSALATDHPIVAWKTYTHVGDAYALTDPVGEAFLGHIEALAAAGTGPAVLAVHKGFGADPADLGPAAAAHPDLTFLAYHSGYEPGNAEGPFDEGGGGVDRFVRSLRDAGVGPGGNVYAELGSTWFNVLTDPDQAAHTLGKLLVALGPERIVWGTDSIWYGSPQDQIEAFRAFEISAEAQERFGYPALTPDVKRLVLGGNAARIHGLDLEAVAAPCRFSAGEREAAREEAFGRLEGTGEALLGPRTAAQARRAFTRDHPWF